MNQEVLDYIAGQRICVLAVEMLDGSPHAATVHFAHAESPQVFLFETYREYRKCEALFGRELSRASVVIGSDEKNMKTLQMDGEVRLLTEAERAGIFQDVYMKKFPGKGDKAKDEKFVPFMFIPKWWRFTDWTRPEGKLIISSEDAHD